MDIQTLAEITAKFLAPFLPYLILASEAAAKEAGKKFGEAAWNKAMTLWEKLKPKVEEKPLLKEATEKVARKPEDKRVIGNLEVELEDVFEQDNVFAQTIQEIHNSIVIGGDVNNANILSNSNNNQIAEKITNIHYHNASQSDVENEKINKAFGLYLEKLRRQCNALPLAALGGDETDEEITLDKIYIDLDTTMQREVLEEATEKEKKGGISGIISRGEFSISTMEVAINNKQLVLLGDAGAGKSTFVKKLLALQAAVLLGETKEALTGFDADLIPVLIVLRDLSPKLANLNLGNVSAENQKQILADLILEKIQEDLKLNKAIDSLPVLEEAFEKGKLLLVLDGLDEVPQNMRKLVRQTVGALIQLNKIERIIITSRSRSYVGEAVFPNFQPFTIAPFDKKKISQFAQAWYNERHNLGHITEEQAKERARDLSDKSSTPDLIDMSSNPMMLTSIAIIHQQDIGLPDQRVKLYKLVVDILIKRWQKYKAGEDNFALSKALTDFLKKDDILLSTLQMLAYEAHRANFQATGKDSKTEKVQKTETDLPRGYILTLLEQSKFLGSTELASEFLDYVDQRSGILVGKGGELEHPTSYSFPHRTIQEYLAGCYLVSSGRNRGREFFNHAAEGDFWSLAALMGAEEIYHNSKNTRDALLDLMYELCSDDSLKNQQSQRALLWSGQIASLFDKKDIEEDEKPNGGKNYLQKLIALTVQLIENNHLSPRERAEAADALDRLGYTPDDLHHFIQLPTPDSQISISKYLITNAQYERFLQPENFQNKNLWINFPKYDENSKPMKETWKNEAWDWLQKELKDKDTDIQNNMLLPRYWRDPRFGINRRNAPVVGISWYEANAYCNWLTQQKDLPEWQHLSALNFQPATFRLPLDNEWTLVAGGDENNRFAFGELKNQKEEIINYANTSESGINRTTPVWMYPQGASKPHGLMDMSGNVWEWQANYSSDTKQYLGLRGGSWINFEDVARVAFRYDDNPHDRNISVGFRVCASSLPKSS